MEWNKYQSTIEQLNLDSYPDEVVNEFYEFINTVPFIRNLISKDRPLCKDVPRDENGRAIIDLTNPPIIENVDYFRQAAIKYQKTGRYTELRPNPNPNSEYGKWNKQEVMRCWYGMVRPEDGAWVSGDMYFFLNYSPIIQSKIRKGTKVADRVIDFPEWWEGIYYRSVYQEMARNNAHHCAEIAKRGAGKSFWSASQLSRNFILGENYENQRSVRSMVMAYQKEYLTKDGTLNKFSDMRDFLAKSTQWPHKTLTKSLDKMQWRIGEIDLNTGAEIGTKNEVLGISSKDDPDKGRGKRSSRIIIEEFGNFPKIIDTYRVMLPSVQEGDIVFGQMSLVGTGGSEGNDFAGAQEILFNPLGYNIQEVPNVYDKSQQSKGSCIFFFPAYLNRKGCYNEDGISDVTKALLEICNNRYLVKYNSTDPMALTRTKAENPITLQEAIMRRDSTIFPVASIMDRIEQIKNEPTFYDDVLSGDLVMKQDGKIICVPSTRTPIRHFPHKDNKLEGCVEIFKLPEYDSNGKPMSNRYISGIDPYDDDSSKTMSLGSIFILDLFTDEIVAEYTGRPMFADDFYEICRKLLLMYNARCNYEAHPYEQNVITPEGKVISWGDIKIGDKLFSIDGTTTKVVDIPFDGEDDIYKITFADGRQVKSSSGHIWKVYRNDDRNKELLVTTKEIYESGVINRFNQRLYFVPDNEAVEYKDKEVPIEPYTMGLLIAEGVFTKFVKDKKSKKRRKEIQFSSSKEDVEFYKTRVPYEIKYIGNKGFSWHMYIDDIDIKLKNLGLLHKDSHSKFIPDLYMYNSICVRTELLRGLMDCDGFSGKNGNSVFVTTSERLCNDVFMLCRSLGIKSKIKKLKNCFRLSISTDRVSLFNLPRKKNIQHIYKPESKGSKANEFLHRTAIEHIEYIGKKKCKCVTVDRSDGLYLIGDYVVTHNCNKKGLFSYFSKMNCLYLLTDTLEFLKDKDDAVGSIVTNKSKGTNATQFVNNYGRRLIRDWLIKPTNIITSVNGEDVETTVPSLMKIRNIALLQELSQWNPDGNFDRVSAMGMLMLLREDKLRLLGPQGVQMDKFDNSDNLANDEFFTKNFGDIPDVN